MKLPLGYNRWVSPRLAPAVVPVASSRKVLAGFLLPGFLFALLGAILPAWGYHLTSDFTTVGNYFLALTAGIVGSSELTRRWLPRRISVLLVTACAVACGGLLCLALASPPVSWGWRMAVLAVIGFDTGLLNTGLFYAISPVYQRKPAATVSLGGVFFGLGCLAAAVLVAGTFYAYTVPSILILVAAVPGLFAVLYARNGLPAAASLSGPTLRQAFRDFRSPGAVLFALLLFFQFGNEWAIAGWLPLFLIYRLGVSPPTALWLLAFYWLALLVGRLAVLAMLPRVQHGKLLLGSVIAALFGCTILLSTNNLFGAATAVLLVGGGFASVYPLVAEKIGRRFPYYNPGFFNGIFSFALIGGMLAPCTLGYFAHAWGIGVVLWQPMLGTCMVFALLLVIGLEAKISG